MGNHSGSWNPFMPANRTLCLLATTCLTAGALLVGSLIGAAGAQAQSLDTASYLSGTSDATGTGLAVRDDGTDDKTAADPYAPAQSRKKKQKKVAASDEGDGLNPRASKLVTLQESEAKPEPDLGRDNTRVVPVDGLRPALKVEDSTPGIALGSFTLRPSLNTSVVSERTSSGGSSSTRGYLQNELKGTLTSDWSRHQLTVTGDGIYQRNISGEGQTEPSASINADLRLDLSRDTIAHLTAGYTLSRESATDPNAVLGAADQSRVQTLSAGGSIERDFGLLRGLAALDVSRTTYSDATLSDGSTVSMSDRDRNSGNLRLRVGYELSPALIPYLEASAGRSLYDEGVDAGGYQRDMKSLGGKAGVEIDLGEKLKGDLGIGYKRVTFADARLAAIDAMVLDAAASWSPRRGTDITIGLLTSVEPSVVAAQSGYIARALTIGLTQQVREDLVLKLGGGATWRNYRPSGSSNNEVVTTLSAGLAYSLNRYMDLTGDISWEKTQPDGGTSTDVLRAGVGLTLKR